MNLALCLISYTFPELSDSDDTAAIARQANNDLGQTEPTSEEELEVVEPLVPREKRGRMKRQAMIEENHPLSFSHLLHSWSQILQFFSNFMR